MIAGAKIDDDHTGVLRDGDDFGCGDTITFTFEYPIVPLPGTFDISQDVN